MDDEKTDMNCMVCDKDIYSPAIPSYTVYGWDVASQISVLEAAYCIEHRPVPDPLSSSHSHKRSSVVNKAIELVASQKGAVPPEQFIKYCKVIEEYIHGG